VTVSVLANRLVVGIVVSTAVALFAFRRGSLSVSGAIAAVVIGTVITVGGGVAWLAAALGLTLAPSTPWAHELAAAFLGALATANGDTWATELGVLSRREPISLVRLARVPRGTSGAVSALGFGATVAGAALIGLVGAIAPAAFSTTALSAFIVAVVGGTAGALVDSIVGATLQARFRCEACARDTEGAVHHCGARTVHTGGLRWLGNDAVNLTATLAGALVAAALAR
jgi:uncharacterized membrane protein